jgi:hypothetical protein
VYKTTLLTGLLGLVILPAALAVAPPALPPSPAELTRLLEQLGHRDYRLREQAERELQRQGSIALPVLRQGLVHKDAEVRRRALRLIPGLEHAALVAPKRVSLLINNKPLSVVLDEISKASGYKVMFNGMMAVPAAPVAAGPRIRQTGAREATYTYQFLNTPFWDVIDRICRDANLSLQQSWGDDIVRLSQGSRAPHTGQDGAFRYVAQNFQMYRTVDLSSLDPRGATAPSRSENLTFSFNLFAEPRLPFLGMGEIRLESAYDSERNSMLIKTNPGEMDGQWVMGRFGRRYYGGGGYKQMTMQASVNLQRPSEKATLLKHIKGVVPVTLLVDQKPVVIAEKILSAKGVKKLAGDVEFLIEEVKKLANNQVQIKMTINYKGKSNDYMWMNTLYQRMELLDDKGNKYQNWGTHWGGNGNNHVNLTMTYGHFGPNGAKAANPGRFIYQLWSMRQHDIVFEFKDVPLP